MQLNQNQNDDNNDNNNYNYDNNNNNDNNINILKAAGSVGKVGFSKAMSAGWITLGQIQFSN